MRSDESNAPPLIVFTDLDGTLLDHDSYSHASAAPALARLRAANVPVVLASSKTAAEIAPLRRALGFSHVPAIVENGAGVLAPGAEGTADGGRYGALRAVLDGLPAHLRAGFQGFGDWGPQGIATQTGLSAQDAQLAAQRMFSEPGLWTGTAADKAEFLETLAASGVQAREGGRFLTLSFGGKKAGQMEAILARYGTPFSVALGDAPNDVEMLERADLGIVVANPHRPPLPALRGEDAGHIRRTTLPGPAGWNGAMITVINEHNL